MSFLHPEFLYYMLPPLFILFGLLLTQKESQAHFFSEDVMSKLRVSANTLTLQARNALFLLIGFFMILALAEPVIKDGTVKIKAKSADIMIALDISDSMLAKDVYPNRLELAKQKALILLDDAPNERIGIVAFAKNSYLVSPLSFDTKAVAFLLRQLNTKSITERGTDFLSVIDIVAKTQKEQKKKYLLLLSDGGDKTDFSKEIDLAKENGVHVFVLAIGTKKGAPIKRADGTFIKQNGDIIISKLNDNIAKLATSTGGVYIKNTTSAKDIRTMFKEISSISDEKELKSEEIPRYTQLFYYPVAMALFLLLIATSSLSRKPLHVAVLMSCLFIANPLHVEAGMLDFMELNKAKVAYEKGEYEKSAKLYNEYANTSTNGQGYYNAGNSYYKQEKYKEAIESYKKATFENPDLRAKNQANLGNSYAKSGELEKAVESYEASLKIKEDQQTKENLEAVKKFIEKQKQDKKDDKKKDDKKKNGDKKEKNDDKKDGEKKDGDKKESDEKQEKSSDEKDKNKDEKDSSKSKDSGDEQKNKDDMKSKKESDEEKQKNEKKSEQKKDKLDKLENKEDKNKDKKDATSASEMKEQKMSDAEEEKWMKQLNSKSNTYLYKLNDDKPKEGNLDEKPW